MRVASEREVEGIIELIRVGLRSGGAHASAEDLPITITQWRSLARRVGRELGRRVQTTGDSRSARASFVDWGRSEEEQAISRDKLRRVVQADSLNEQSEG